MNEAAPAPCREELLSSRPVRNPRLKICFWCLAFVATALISSGYIYYTIFSRFQPYDDEGYILLSLKTFFQGKPLYDEVYSSFQPAFYVLHWLLFKMWGAPLGHDSIRLLTLVLWMTGSFLNGLVTYRLTISKLAALFVSIITVQCLEPFANEPGHPQALAYVLVVSVVALLAFSASLHTRPLAVLIGVLIGLALLTKINVGIFVLLPVWFLLASTRNGKVARLFKISLGLIMLLLPVVLWRVQLASKGTPLVPLCLVELFGLLMLVARLAKKGKMALVVAAGFVCCSAVLAGMETISVGALPVFSAGLLSLSICGALLISARDSEDLNLQALPWTWVLPGLGSVLVVVLLFTIVRGTSLHGLANGLIWWPAKVSGSFLIRLRSNWLGLCLGLIGAASCYAQWFFRERWESRLWWKVAMIAGQLGFGVAVLAEFFVRVQGSSTLMPILYDLPHFWMLPFAWLVAMPGTGAEETLPARRGLLLIGVMQPLIACPIAGTQLVPASMLIPILGAVSLANGLRACLAGANSRFSLQRIQFTFGAVGVCVLLIPLAVHTQRLQRQYNAREPLNLPGATRIRLTSEEVSVYRQVSAQLARPEVQTFLTLPGLDSFYLWAQKDPPNGLNVSAWIVLLDDLQQEKIWNDAQKHPGLMVVRNRKLIRSWVAGRPVAALPLVRHMNEDFKPESSYGGYELMTRR